MKVKIEIIYKKHLQSFYNNEHETVEDYAISPSQLTAYLKLEAVDKVILTKEQNG